MSLPSTHVLSRHASAHLMEEIVHLWELTIMTPYLNKDTKLQMKVKFEFWNQQVVESGRKGDSSIHVYIFIVFFFSKLVKVCLKLALKLGHPARFSKNIFDWICF